MRLSTEFRELGFYLSRQASSIGRYCLEQTLYLLVGWIPTVVGIGIRGMLYKIILNIDGWAAIEDGVRLRFGNYIWHCGIYSVHINCCPGSLFTGL